MKTVNETLLDNINIAQLQEVMDWIAKVALDGEHWGDEEVVIKATHNELTNLFRQLVSVQYAIKDALKVE